MAVRITGKSKVLAELEKAQKLIEEAGKILWHLPSEISLEVTEGLNQIKDAPDDQDNQ